MDVQDEQDRSLTTDDADGRRSGVVLNCDLADLLTDYDFPE
jgi:hypothetical protein